MTELQLARRLTGADITDGARATYLAIRSLAGGKDTVVTEYDELISTRSSCQATIRNHIVELDNAGLITAERTQGSATVKILL